MMRLFRLRRLRWVAAGAAVRFLVRKTTARQVEQAAADLEERLPQPVRRALEVVPDGAMWAGGSAVVAGRTARRVAVGTRTVGRVGVEGTRRVNDGVARIRNLGDDVGREVEIARRQLTSRYLEATDGPTAADDTLLDLRRDRRADAEDELPTVRPATRRGRWRAERRRRSAGVARVQRSYRPASRPWDR
ncbi:MAG: hypothetical protein AAF547_00760 [Actinomycetota bacterium]